MPNTVYDLHLHTNYSDGRAAPGEVLRHAALIGLKTVAITDHDNVNAYTDASWVAAQLGLELIPAIELTSHWQDCNNPEDVDVLGYFIDPQSASLLAYTALALRDLEERIEDCCHLLTEAGFPVRLRDVRVENSHYSGAMQVLLALEHKGLVRNWSEAIAVFNAQWPKVRPCRFEIAEVIQQIHAAGGVAVLAHPVAIHCPEGRLSAGQLEKLVQAGLDGLEIYHPRLNHADRGYFRDLAHHFGLLVTGGSDEHGWQSGFPRMGMEPVELAMVQALQERALLWKEHK